MNKNIQKIAIIGGGFAGLATSSKLIHYAEQSSVNIAITLFETKEPTRGGAFDIDLPDNFTLNHEADFMGTINLNDSYANSNDFYRWLQVEKKKSLNLLGGLSIKDRYKSFDLDNPKSFLPRSLYGIYLYARLQELINACQGKFYSFTYKEQEVIEIKKSKLMYLVKTRKEKELFDKVIICTGCKYNTQLSTSKIGKDKKIGIIGTGLSGIEISLALAEKGYEDITLFSRNGRLPKVRGVSNSYNLQYVTTDKLNQIKNKKGYFIFPELLQLLKMEFDYAYRSIGGGLYQIKGINWLKVLENKNPVDQLKEDINYSLLGKEVPWRSVCLALAKIKPLLLPYLSPADEKMIFGRYSSLILSFTAPIPLFQAKKLLRNMEKGIIKIKKITFLERKKQNWEIIVSDSQKLTIDFLVNAKGPVQSIEKDPFIFSLLKNNLASKNPSRGLQVNKIFQSIVKGKAISNFYILGSVMQGYAPINNSTVYLNTYIETICQNAIYSIKTREREKQETNTLLQRSLYI